MKRAWPAIPVAIVIAIFALRACVTEAQTDRLAVSRVHQPMDPPGATVWTGSLSIARGGPVIVGVQSDVPARLSIMGQDLHGVGVNKSRIILPAGPIAIRLAARPEAHARLVWSPVGRRGDPEYVPTSSLSPEPPERATFPASVGAAPLDGVFALAILATIVGAILYAARARLRAVPRDAWIVMGGVFAAALLVRLVGLGAMGQTWDEDVNWAAGRNYVTNVLALDGSARSWQWNFEHPPVMKYLVGIGAQLADGFGPARAMSALVSAVGCLFLVAIGRRLYSLRAGAIAGGIAALSPTLVAHGQIVGHESPTLLWWTLGILVALGVHDGVVATRQLVARLAIVGAIVGVAIDSRFVNGLLGPLVAAIVVVQAPPAWRRRTLTWGAAVMPVAAVVVAIALWPRLWGHPIDALRESFKKLDTAHAMEPFLGAMTNKPGPHYFLVALFATSSIGILLGVAAFAWRSIKTRTGLVAILAFVVPLGVAASPVRQDGVRYVIPCVAALALMAGAGYDAVIARLGSPRACLAVLTAYFAITLARIYPYGLDYFGEHVGGPSSVAAHRWMETAWWGEGLAEALDYVDEHAAPDALVYRDCVLPGHLAWFRYDLWKTVPHDPAKAAWIVWYAPATSSCKLPPDAKLVYEATAGGAPLARVYRR